MSTPSNLLTAVAQLQAADSAAQASRSLSSRTFEVEKFHRTQVSAAIRELVKAARATKL
jgi:hypothetical protein